MTRKAPSGAELAGMERAEDALDGTSKLSAAEVLEDEERQVADVDLLLGLRAVEGAEGVKWNIYRVADGFTRKLPGYLDTWSTPQLQMDALRDAFGKGRYRIRGHYNNGQFAAQRTVDIAADAAPGAEPAAGALAVRPGVADPNAILTTIREEERARREEARDRQMEYARLLVPALSPIIAALLGNRGPDVTALVAALKGPTMPEMMQGLASLKALAPEQTTDPIDRALKLLDVIQEKIPSGGGETNWLDVVREAIKSVGPTLGGAIEGAIVKANATPLLPAPNAGRPPALAAPPGSPAPSVATTGAQPFSQSSGGTNMAALLQWLASQIEFLIVKAARGSDPALYAEVLLDSVPDGLSAETVAQLVARPDWFKYLCQLDSRAQQYEAWFGRLRASILAELEVDDTQQIPSAIRATAQAQKEERGAEIVPEQPVQRPSGKPPSLTE